MRFEPRDLPPHAEPISITELAEGSVYFLIGFVDEEMLTPKMETLVFIGRNLETGDEDRYYFQDIESYREGERYGPGATTDGTSIFVCSLSELNGVYDFEHALEVLMRCSLRRTYQ